MVVEDNIFLLEKKENDSEILSLKVTLDDKLIISGDANGNLVIYNNTLEFVKKLLIGEVETSLHVEIDYSSTNVVISKDSYCISVLDLKMFEVKYKIFLDEEIVRMRFSYMKSALILLTDKGKIKFYSLGDSRAELVKEFGYLHDGRIKDFAVSFNCAYLFTTGEDQCVKVWDYNFRGNLLPVSQSFSTNEVQTKIIATNDAQNVIITINQDDNIINGWNFKNSLDDLSLMPESNAEAFQETQDEDFLIAQNEFTSQTQHGTSGINTTPLPKISHSGMERDQSNERVQPTPIFNQLTSTHQVGVSRPYNYDPNESAPRNLPDPHGDTDFGFSKNVRFGDDQILKSVATDDLMQDFNVPGNNSTT